VVVQDVQGTIDDLRREVAEGPSQRRLLEIVEAADRFRHELDAPPEESRADPVASLDLARRAFRAAQREVR
ncbi:MAG: hypothetical protein KTR31_31060, partial [Myxococcales bacterium]|nr:hypothetical protein [Myxococcales bacterium]